MGQMWQEVIAHQETHKDPIINDIFEIVAKFKDARLVQVPSEFVINVLA